MSSVSTHSDHISAILQTMKVKENTVDIIETRMLIVMNIIDKHLKQDDKIKYEVGHPQKSLEYAAGTEHALKIRNVEMMTKWDEMNIWKQGTAYTVKELAYTHIQ